VKEYKKKNLIFGNAGSIIIKKFLREGNGI